MDIDRFGFIRKAFENIGMAKVSMSADEAFGLGFLLPGDRISINKDTLIEDAKQMALNMANCGFIPPVPRSDLKLPGESAFGAILAFLYQMKEGGWLSDHDMLVGKKLAYVLTGGKASPMKTVDEQYILDLEREAFMSLIGEEKSQARMQYMLLNNKPLRN
jgi:3-hydroxyacyl-CoA dehydrogenase